MWNRKNFLIFAIFFNCVYFAGTSFLVTRHVSKHNQLIVESWIGWGSEAIFHKLILDINNRKFFADEFKRIDFEKEIMFWAKEKNITNVVELKETTAVSWVGSRHKVPFDRKQLQYLEDVGFFKDKNSLNFNYFLPVDGRQFFITQQVDESELLVYLQAYGMDVTFAESDGETNAHALFTTLPKNIADELLQKTSFEKPQTLIKHMTLAKEIYMVAPLELIPHGPLKQKMLFTRKLKSHEFLKISDVLIYIWTFFCISIALNVVIFKYADR